MLKELLPIILAMRVRISSIGRFRELPLREAEAEYEKRMQSLFKLEFLELDFKISPNVSPDEMKKREAEGFIKKIGKPACLVLLDPAGREVDSPGFAKILSARLEQGQREIDFALGGVYGWGKEALEQASLVLSLSRLTFTYQMSRLILIEQLYRAFTIIRGAPYHK